jgi:hypothetical protein
MIPFSNNHSPWRSEMGKKEVKKERPKGENNV